jgi:hypothetical protein
MVAAKPAIEPTMRSLSARTGIFLVHISKKKLKNNILFIILLIIKGFLCAFTL